MDNTFFITGTSTGVGKTSVCTGLLRAAGELGMSTLAIKPLASGSEMTPRGLRNDDALALQEAMSIALPYERVNPYAFAPAIAPHIAARQAGVSLSIDALAQHCRELGENDADLTLIEGAGGWRVPVNEQEFYSELPARLGIPVILVVGMQLGCINHALLSYEAIRHDGVPVAGWIANCTRGSMSCYPENIAAIKKMMSAPLLGEIPFQSSFGSFDKLKYIYKNIISRLRGSVYELHL